MDEIVGNREAINPRHVLESSSIEAQSSPQIDQDIRDKQILDEEVCAAASAQKSKLVQSDDLPKLKIAPFFGANQFRSSRFFNVACSTTMKIKRQERLLDFSRSISFLFSHKDYSINYLPWQIQTNKGCAKRRGKAQRRQREVRRFTRFVDYGLMFDLTRSF